MTDITRRPTGDGDIGGVSTGHNYGTYYYECVNEETYDDSYYAWRSGVAYILYTFNAPNVPDGVTVNYVRIYYRHQDAESTVNARIKVGGNYYDVDTGHARGSFTTDYYDYTVNPKTGSAWTVSDVNTPGNANGLQQFGDYGGFGGSSSTSWCYMVINYTENAPTVTTQDVTNITDTTATGNGNVTSDGGNTITERGVCWVANTGTPTTADSKATHTGTTGAYDPDMTNLSAGTHYHVRAYAINGIGTSYGSQVEFSTTGGAGLMQPDGPGKMIGSGCWGFIS